MAPASPPEFPGAGRTAGLPAATMPAFIILGDAIRDAFEPKLR